MGKKKEEKKSQAKYKKEEKGKTYIKKTQKSSGKKTKTKNKERKKKKKHLNACANMEAIEEGKRAHEQIIEIEWDLDAFVGRSLVDMYTKCGRMEDV
jgi:hypothetical protein